MNKHIQLTRKRQIAFYNGYASENQFHAISKMGGGLPEPLCRRRFQTTICCCFLRVMVVSNMGKGSIRSQVSAMETNKTEPLLKCRKHKDVIKTGVGLLPRDESESTSLRKSDKAPDVVYSHSRAPVCCSDGGRYEGGVNIVQALIWNLGTCILMQREKSKRKNRKDQNTEAEYRDGTTRSSDESS